jgi:hypothetical protein
MCKDFTRGNACVSKRKKILKSWEWLGESSVCDVYLTFNEGVREKRLVGNELVWCAV